MTQFKKQLIGVLSTGLIVASTILPSAAFADTTLVITGNGESSLNNTTVVQTNTTTVSQNNNAQVTNTVNANADSGANTAKGVTGGSVAIDTGNATSNVTVANTLNKNAASVQCCAKGDTTVVVSGNGEQSQNTAGLTQDSKNTLWQTNHADVTNTVHSDANTGQNKVESTTGGDVTITTGDAKAKANVSTTANANEAQIGSGSEIPGSTTLLITGNGENTKNTIGLTQVKTNTIYQKNDAWVANYVDAMAKTGENTAKSITGGSVLIDTGKATAETDVTNKLNLNAAFVRCNCDGDVFGKIGGNGEDSRNNLGATLVLTNNVFQGGNQEDFGNNAWVSNGANANGKSGRNNVESTVGSLFGLDPVVVMTGDSAGTTMVANMANENLFGTLTWPVMPWGLSISL